MIRMIGELSAGAIELLGDDEPHQHVRQRRRAERPALVGPRQHVRRVAVGAADQECEIAPWHAPPLELRGELLAGPGGAASIERDDVRILRDAARTAAPSSAIARAGSRPLPRVAELDLDEFERQLVPRRFPYSAKPSATHAGMRSPTAISRACRAGPLGRGLASRAHRAESTRCDQPAPAGPPLGMSVADRPQAFEAVESRMRGSITWTTISPRSTSTHSASRWPSTPSGGRPGCLAFLDDFVGDRFHVPRRGTAERRP